MKSTQNLNPSFCLLVTETAISEPCLHIKDETLFLCSLLLVQSRFHRIQQWPFVCCCVVYSHPNAAGLESAKKLTESLLETVSS